MADPDAFRQGRARAAVRHKSAAPPSTARHAASAVRPAAAVATAADLARQLSGAVVASAPPTHHEAPARARQNPAAPAPQAAEPAAPHPARDRASPQARAAAAEGFSRGARGTGHGARGMGHGARGTGKAKGFELLWVQTCLDALRSAPPETHILSCCFLGNHGNRSKAGDAGCGDGGCAAASLWACQKVKSSRAGARPSSKPLRAATGFIPHKHTPFPFSLFPFPFRLWSLTIPPPAP